MRQITQRYLAPLRKTIPVGGFPPLRPKCHTTVVTSTKMECSAMIIIDKGPNKGLLFEPNIGSNLGHPVGFLFCPEFLPPQIHPTTRWLDYKSGHTMVPSHSGFFLFYHYNLQGSCLRTVIQPLVETAGLLISWVFLFYTTNHTSLNGSTRGGPFRPTPWAKSLILTVPGLGLSPQRHIYGSESVPIVQGLV